MARRKRNDPDRTPAEDGITLPLRPENEGGVGGTTHIWEPKDGEALVLNEWDNGNLTAYIESDPDEEE